MSCERRRWRTRRSGSTRRGRGLSKCWWRWDRWSASSLNSGAATTRTRRHRRREKMLFRRRAGAGRALGVVGVLCLVGSTGCGYALAGRGSFLPASIKTIGVPTFANRTTVFNIETLLTQKVRSEFIGRGKYTVLPQATDVDALLTGQISAITIHAASFTAADLPPLYFITLTAPVDL